MLFSYLFACLLNVVAAGALAAPHPGMGSSRLQKMPLRLRVETHTFSLLPASPWEIVQSFDPKLKSLSFRNLQRPSAKLQVRWESLKSAPSLEGYAKRWMKDYNNYGFEVLGTKSFEDKAAKGLVIDLKHAQFGKTQRQVIYLLGKKVVVFSCTDSTQEFADSLKDCNQIIRGFAWDNSSSKN